MSRRQKLPRLKWRLEPAPRTGVEVVSVEERSGARYYTMRDLRNGNVVKNVTRTSARRLWHYAITRFARFPADLSQEPISWQGNLGLVKAINRAKTGTTIWCSAHRRASAITLALRMMAFTARGKAWLARTMSDASVRLREFQYPQDYAAVLRLWETAGPGHTCWALRYAGRNAEKTAA